MIICLDLRYDSTAQASLYSCILRDENKRPPEEPRAEEDNLFIQKEA